MRLNVLLSVGNLAWSLGMTPLALAEGTAALDAPASVPAGSNVTVKWTGPGGLNDRIAVVPAGTPESQAPTAFQTYPSYGNPAHVRTPETPGEYEIVYLASAGGAPLARRKLRLLPVTATIRAPAAVVGGSKIAVVWTGPNNPDDQIAVFPAGAPENTRAPIGHSTYLYDPSPAQVIASEKPGEYEIRYLTGRNHRTLARTKVSVIGARASVTGPQTAISGETVSVAWTGPNNPDDQIAIFPAGAPDNTQAPIGQRTYLYDPSPAHVTTSEKPGEYEIRYITGQSHATLARDKLTVTRTSASIDGKSPVAPVLPAPAPA